MRIVVTGANGSVAPDGPVTVPSGANQSFTISPDTCYQVADVNVDGVSVGSVTSYTFTGVTNDHSVAASFSAAANGAACSETPSASASSA